MITKARRQGRWSASIGAAWLIGVLVFAWAMGTDPSFESEGGGSWSASTTAALLVASLLGLATGLALIMERRTEWILWALPAAAFLATITTAMAFSSTGGGGGGGDMVTFVFFWIWFAGLLGLPVGAGVLLGALSRLALRRLAGRSTPVEPQVT